MADQQEANQNFVEQLDKTDIQSVSSNGVTVNLRTSADKKAEVEKEILEDARKYNPMRAFFGAGKWGSMR